MSLISLKNVSKSYYDKKILNLINLQINQGEKVAIIGENGTGKTTLFRLILGLENADSENAEIIIAKNIIIGYLEQQFNSHPGQIDALFDQEIFNLQEEMHQLEEKISAQYDKSESERKQLYNRYDFISAKFESLSGYTYQYRLVEILAGLGIGLETAKRPLNELSGGEKMRVELAKLLIREPDVMLLDEPTNHLDHKAIEWLEKFLKSTKSTILVISHDRLFIDRIATRTVELSNGELTSFPGNYTNFIKLKTEQQKSIKRSIDKLENNLSKQAEITQTMLSHRKMNSYHSSQKKADRLSKELSNLKSKKETAPTKLNFKIIKNQDLGDPNRTLISANELSVKFPGENLSLFEPFSWSLQAKQKLVIVGANGCGKTTLLKSLLGIEPNASGLVHLASDIKYGILGQQVEFSNESQTVIESLTAIQENWTEGRARNELAKYGFRGINVFKTLNALSGGERSRLYLCHLLSENPDMLFLDEPTNHLDINSCEILEQALADYEGSIIAVSHDRYFIERIGQYILGFINRNIIRFNNYASFRKTEEQMENHDQNKPHAEDTDLTTKKLDKSPNKTSSSNIQTKEELWSDQEIKVQKSLKKIKNLPNNQVQTRRFKALADDSITELIKKLEIAENKKLNLEEKFITTSNPELYHQYDQLLVLIEQYELIYLKLAELLENLA